MRTVTRRWWKAAAAAVVLSAGGYVVFGPDAAATAQVPAQATWVRSSSPLAPAAAASTPLPPSPGAVIRASAVIPAAQPPVPALPTLPNTPPVPPPPLPAQSQPEFRAPAIPQLPGGEAPAAPVSSPPPAVTVPAAPAFPSLITPAPVVAPPAPPAKSALPAEPAAPAKAVSPLRLPDGGTSVKTDAAWKAGPAVAPPPREVTRPAPLGPVVDRSKPPEAPVPPSERDVFPLPPPAAPAMAVATPLPLPPAPPVVPPATPKTDPVATTPGADPMTFKSTAAAAVLGGALVLPQAKADAPAGGGAQDSQKDKSASAPKTTDEKLADIQQKLARLTELLDGRKDETGARLPSDPGLVQQLRDLKDKVAALESQMSALKSTSLRPPAGGTTPGAGSPVPGIPNPMPGAVGNPTPPAPAVTGTGTVRVVNEYPVEITMVVNGRSYRVAPNATQDISTPAGDFSYQLLSGSTALAPTRSTIRDREVVTLRIK